MNRLTDRVAIVTGASKGIGRAIARLYAEQGAGVLLVYRSDDAGAGQAVEEIQQAGGVAAAFKADVSRQADTLAMADEALRRWGRIDILCASAGIVPDGAMIEQLTEEDWDRVIAVNLKGVFLSVKACLPAMIGRQYGRIVIIASLTGPKMGIPGYAHYGASKAGICGFIHSACQEFAAHQITINALEPGWVLTEGLRRVVTVEMIREMEREIPLRRVADPREVAQAALFLASGESGYITGQSIVVDGGLMLPEVPLRFFEQG